MTSRKSARLLLIFAVAACSKTAFCQEVLWTQPYSGQVVAGPFAVSSGELPNCPDCDCPKCRPDGCDGVFKRFWGGVYNKFRRCRRECYFNKQIYHTGYTYPVLPPYCEPGFGYYETAWRQPVPCLTGGPYGDLPLEPAIVPADPQPAAPMPAEVETMPEPKPAATDEPMPKYENGPEKKVPIDPRGDEKPPYEESPPKEQAGTIWKPIAPQSEFVYPYHSFRR